MTINDKELKKAIIISIVDDTIEIKKLLQTLEYDVVNIFIQHRIKPDVKSYIGLGKVEEIKSNINDKYNDIDLIVINGDLKPSQWFYLEKNFNIKVFDRLRLILEIFKIRADSKEAKLQVRLAELQYDKPYVMEIIHRSRNGEHPGFMAGGEYQVDDYFEMIKKQIKKIKISLNKIRKEREIHRKNRVLKGFYLLSLAGYTNAGKSSILNLLSNEKIKVENKLFSTLSTTSRKINNSNIPILITDTVGFIDNLPAWMINAFHSTLEEIVLSDLVLLIIDSSDDLNSLHQKIDTSFRELRDIGVNSQIIIVLNKIDLISKKDLENKIRFLENLEISKNRKIIGISAKSEKYIKNLLDLINKNLPNFVKFKVKFKSNQKTQSLINWIYDRAFVSNISYENENILISIECSEFVKNLIISKLDSFYEFEYYII